MKQRRNTAFIVIAIMFLALTLACGGGENTTGNNGGNPAATPAATPAAGGTEVAATKPVSSEDAQKLYKGRCVSCHGDDGKGKKDFSPKSPDFTDAAWQKTKTDEQLATSITDGIGSGTKGSMPRWKGLLKPEEIQALVAHVRTYAK